MLDLVEIINKWLRSCGACDAGLPITCSHPQEDYRPVILELVRELEKTRDICPYDCDRCHGDGCSCDRMGCNDSD